MKTSICVFVVSLLSTVSAFAQSQVVEKTILHNGIARDYIVHIPSSYNPESSIPLVLTFHSLDGNAGQMMITSVMNEASEREGFLAVYPDSPGGWAANSNDNNVTFVDQLLEDIASEYAVDASRVYASGFSDGGVMSYVLGVSRPDVFAAIASVSGTRAGNDNSNLFPFFVESLPNRPLPLLHIHGTSDMVIPYQGGVVPIPGIGPVPFPATPSILADWAQNNGCGEIGPESPLEDIYPEDTSTVSLFEYQDCGTYVGTSGVMHSAEVLHYQVEGGGHGWPVLESDREASMAALVEALGEELVGTGGVVNSDISSSEVIWRFFERHELPSGPQLGDCNIDGVLSELDLSCVATIESRDMVLQELGTLPGDLDGDGRVEFADFLTLSNRFGQIGSYTDGNIDLAGAVDFADFLVLSSNFGKTVNASSVPEPDSGDFACIILLGLWMSFRKSARHSTSAIG